MKPKISIILPTNRINSNVFCKIQDIQDGFEKYDYSKRNIFTHEFIPLLTKRIDDINHYLQLTLNSLEEQRFKDYELIISHRYPKDAIDIVKEYDIPIKLIKEKHSIWHDLGDSYGTLCNNINTAVIHSSGELLWRLDDMELFNKYTLEELWGLYKKGNYATSRTIRNISFDESIKNEEGKVGGIHAAKYRFEKYHFRGIVKPLRSPIIKDDKRPLPIGACWGYSSTISTDDFLNINGHDEVFDGSVCGTDMELGNRLAEISTATRLATNNWIYEIDDSAGIIPKSMTRNDMKFREILRNKGYIANSWKPNERERRIYKKWHEKNIGEIDTNWDSFMQIPYINLREEHNLKKLGEVVYDNTDN